LGVVILGVVALMVMGLVLTYGLSILIAVFTAYMGYVGISELGIDSEFFKLFGGMIGFFIGLWMKKFVVQLFNENLNN
jgi:Zn-dependent protease with chaperone function